MCSGIGNMLATKVNFLPSNVWYIFPKPYNSFTTAVNQCVILLLRLKNLWAFLKWISWKMLKNLSYARWSQNADAFWTFLGEGGGGLKELNWSHNWGCLKLFLTKYGVLVLNFYYSIFPASLWWRGWRGIVCFHHWSQCLLS